MCLTSISPSSLRVRLSRSIYIIGSRQFTSGMVTYNVSKPRKCETAHSSVALIADTVLGAPGMLQIKLDLFPFRELSYGKTAEVETTPKLRSTEHCWSARCFQPFRPRTVSTQQEIHLNKFHRGSPSRDVDSHSVAYYKSQRVNAARIGASSLSPN